VASSSTQVFAKALKLSALLVVSVAVICSIIGFLVVGVDGLWTALIGSTIALAFTSLTVLSVLFGARLPLGGFYGLVLGGWLLKIVLFAVLMAALQRMEFIHGPTLFFAIVLSVLGSLGIDSWVVLRSRIPTIDSRD
jgi:F0F1-type ATP synthase assembly protein I